MDFIRKAMNKQSKPAGQPATAGTATNDDYGDKAAKALAGRVAPGTKPATLEKVTDLLRTTFEKLSGKKVDPKYSN